MITATTTTTKITDVNVLRYLLFNTDVRKKINHILQPQMFIDEHCKQIFILATMHEKETTSHPKTIEVLIADNPWRQTAELIKQKLEIVAVDPKTYEKQDITTVIKQISEWVKSAKFRMMLEQGVRAYKEDNFDHVETLRKEANEINAFNLDTNGFIDVDDIERMIEIHTLEVPRITSDWRCMNDFLGGGWKKKSVNVFQGGTHQGKSRFLFSLANSFRRASPDNHVLYITLEIQDMDFGIFSDMHLLGMTAFSIRNLILNNREEYIRLKKEAMKTHGKLFIQEFPASNCTIGLIRKTVDSFLSMGYNISACCFDYLQIMKAGNANANMFERGAENVIALRSLSQEYEIPFFTGVQPNREGNRKNVKGGGGADMMDTGESKAIPDTSDFFANLCQTPEQYRMNKQIMTVLKNRHSGRIYEGLGIDIMKELYRVDVVDTYEIGNDTQGSDDIETIEPIDIMGGIQF